jgi:uncharacterized MAPEG superfamily protein
MTTELTLLAWTLVLAVVQILLAAHLRTRETGFAYNVSPRDEPSPVPPGLMTGRVMRAQQNLMETLPLFIAAVLIVQTAHLHGPLTLWGTRLYFCARVIHLPLYAFGIPYLRTLVWLASLAGLVMLLLAILE